MYPKTQITKLKKKLRKSLLNRSVGNFSKKKLIKPEKKTKKGKSKAVNVVVCQHKTKKGICNKVIPFNDSSTGKMVRHLKNKHKTCVTKKEEGEENDAPYFLLMFIVTASLPFRCVDNEFFKNFVSL